MRLAAALVLSSAAATTASAGQAASRITCAAGHTGVQCTEAVTVRAGSEAFIRPVSSITLTDEELRAIGTSSEEWVAFARRTAGMSVGDVTVYVDGMPARANLPPSEIARISVNSDPFTAEYTGVNQLRVDIDSRPPDRRWRFHSGLPSFTSGGSSRVAASGSPASRRLSGGLSGPVGQTPLTFSINGMDTSDRQEPIFADAASGRLVAARDLRVSTESSRATAGLVLSTARVLARLTGSVARTRSHNSGIGGIHAASTAQALDTADGYVQASWRATSPLLVHRGGATFTRSRLESTSSPNGPAVVVTGQSTGGGHELTASRHDYLAWDVKHVVTAPGGRRPWKAGVEAARTVIGDMREWNRDGRLQLASPSSAAAVWTLARGVADVTAAASSAAAFAEQTVMQGRGSLIRAGGRVDWQHGDGVIVSPRLSAGTRARGFLFSAGAGLFVQPWVPDTFAAAALRSAGDMRVLAVPAILLQEALPLDPDAGERLRTSVAGSFVRRRDLQVRAGIQRHAGPLQVGLERSWTFGNALGGAVRLRDEAGLVDRVDSDRRLRRTRTHARTSVNVKHYSLAARYEHVSSMDNSDGPFTLPALQGDVGGEWAPSTAVPRHTVTLTAGLALPASVRMTVTYDTKSGARHNVISGTDEEGLGTFTGRAGLPRNSGVLPAARTLSIYLARSVRLKLVRTLTLDLGARADNVMDRENVTLVGRVLGSALFGQPLAAAPGRSIRIWASVRR